ncbi:UNVERIFIED_CONTAM: helix-turn-helix domain-containing protein, partial [Kocuria sp. CPCC 205295]
TLALVEEDLGAAAAREAARELVVFMQRPGGQAQFSSSLRQAAVGNAGLQAVMAEVLEHPEQGHSVVSMAERLGVSSRQLYRLVRAETGLSPAQWLEAARVDAAREIIHGDLPLTSVARRAGFGSDETMRRAFLRQLGVTPSGFRDRFTSTGSSA